MSVYSLDDEDRADVESIFHNFPKLVVVEKYKKALEEMTEKACDELQAYLEDEYALRLTYSVERQARKVVEALLRGENLDTFGLKLREMWGKSGEFYAYDGEKVREAIIRDFAHEIQTAEMHELAKENARLKEDLAMEGRYR